MKENGKEMHFYIQAMWVISTAEYKILEKYQ
jgi:hypothetical protein